MNKPVAESSLALPLGRGVTVIARDAEGVIAFAKPAGLLSHPNTAGGDARALLTCSYDADAECFVWPQPDGSSGRLWLLNRLDSATSGLILAALREPLARAIRGQFARRQVHKRYRALVFGVPRAPDEVWRDRLAIDKRGGAIRARVAGNLAAEARCVTLVRRPALLDSRAPLALVQLEPRTGRSHQLRVQCARHGLPIVGDQTYGDFRLNREFARFTGVKRLFLHSMETRFSYEIDGRTHAFAAVAPVPPEFDAALG